MTVPTWLAGLVAHASDPARVRPFQRELPPTGQQGHRQSAVLLLFAPTGATTHASSDAPSSARTAARATTSAPDAASARATTSVHSTATVLAPGAAGSSTRSASGLDPVALEDISILLTERAHTLRSHPGQVSFPGGRAEPSDRDLVATALRETSEEVGVEPGTVEVAGILPALNLSVSSHDVSPVLGWWSRPGRVWARDPAEVASVLQVPIADLVDPANRFRVGSPSGWIGPAFDAGGLLVWGFTAMVLADVLHVAGWEVPWDESDVRAFPSAPGARLT